MRALRISSWLLAAGGLLAQQGTFVAVTDRMLENPDPADWLMIRHDYQANYFSPLNQINAQNVSTLRLMWSWSMQDGAVLGNQPAPIVHNGVL